MICQDFRSLLLMISNRRKLTLPSTEHCKVPQFSVITMANIYRFQIRHPSTNYPPTWRTSTLTCHCGMSTDRSFHGSSSTIPKGSPTSLIQFCSLTNKDSICPHGLSQTVRVIVWLALMQWLCWLIGLLNRPIWVKQISKLCYLTCSETPTLSLGMIHDFNRKGTYKRDTLVMN
jgi:hypothetical protein